MPDEERKRVAWLRADLGRLKRGEITEAALRKRLTADELQQYKDQHAGLDDVETDAGDLKRYIELVKQADLMNAAANRCKTYQKAVKARNQSEALYERALEHLQELLEVNKTLREQFDRDPYYIAGGEAGIDVMSIPRLKTSKSKYNKENQKVQTKNASNKRTELIEFVEHLVNGYKWP